MIKTGYKQGCITSSCFFNIILDWVLLKPTSDCNDILVRNNLQIYADDLAYMDKSETTVQRFLDNLDINANMIVLNIDIKEKNVMDDFLINISVNIETIQQVDNRYHEKDNDAGP